MSWVIRVASGLLLCALAACDSPPQDVAPEPAVASIEAGVPEREGAGDFADPATCASCHPSAQAAWQGSHHDRAIEVASEESVLGDFDDSVFEHFGATTRFHRVDGQYRVETIGPDGAPGDFEVVYTFGVEPLQQYLLRFPDGRLQSLTIAWDTERKRWFSLYPDEAIAPDDPLHWTGSLQRWNSMCADCHSTSLDRGYDVSTGTYETAFVALDVSCQACHGPAAAHVEWAGGLEPGAAVPADADRRIALAAGSLADAELSACAPCHSRRHRVSAEAAVGEPFLDHYAPELLRPGLYHADGQIDGEVYVYGSFVQSLMHRRGVRCSDCHEPHALALRAEGNDLCTRCHAPEPDPRFPTLARRAYDAAEHHFHTPGGAGSGCVDCHMPSKTYMQVDGRRDHSLRIPRPDLTLSIGTPNPCSGCHADRGAGWAADFLASRRASGESLPVHFGEALAGGRAGSPEAVAPLVALAVSESAPAIARATAIEILAVWAGAPRVTGALVEAANDPEPIVRSAVAASLAFADPARGVPALAGLVGDERRAVRVEAAQVLSGLPLDSLTPAQRTLFADALDEYRAAQLALGDTPEAHLNLGVIASRRGRPTTAESEYGTALEMQSSFLPARVNLANLLNTQGRNEEAEKELRTALAEHAAMTVGVEDDPAARSTRGELHYSLALLLAEQGRLEDAEAELRRAVERLPTRPRIRYNLGLAQQQLGTREAAEASLMTAETLAPENPDIQNALAIFYAQTGRKEAALRHARRLVELTAGAPGTRELVEQIQAMDSTGKAKP
jgi:predicted CXXCH cytochrome family protein